MSDQHDGGTTDDLGDDAVPMTGHASIDEALQRLERLREIDVSLHPEEFDAVHTVLRESLANAGRESRDGIAAESP